MKKIISILLAAVLLFGFAACAKDTGKPSTTAPATTKPATTQATTKATTQKPSQTTKPAKIDTAFIYSGYWYKNEENKVIAFQFGKDGTVTLNTYRRKNIADGNNAPDSIIYGNFKDNGDGTLTVYPDNEVLDAYDIYNATADGKLIFENDDPEGSKTIELQHFDALSKDNASKVLFG